MDRYTIVTTTAVFFTEVLNFPDWNVTVCIIDNVYKVSVMRSGWISPEFKPDWRKIISDKIQ